MEQGTEIRGIVRAVCISPEKGTEKRPVPEAFFKKDFGIEGDAHAGKWHRQVSFLGLQEIPPVSASLPCILPFSLYNFSVSLLRAHVTVFRTHHYA